MSTTHCCRSTTWTSERAAEDARNVATLGITSTTNIGRPTLTNIPYPAVKEFSCGQDRLLEHQPESRCLYRTPQDGC